MSPPQTVCEKDTESPRVELKYPDGGWGWVVVFAAAFANFITIPVMQSFALIFQGRMKELNMSPTDLTTIINVNGAFGMGLGLINGPLTKMFGYRKIAFAGGLLSFMGLTATSWASNFLHFLITYSIITSMGTFMLMSSFTLAINTYFRERRGYASGISTAITGLGPVVMPQVITFLLRHYNTQGTTLILGGLSLHSVMAALLLQPVKWHMKKVKIDEELNISPPEEKNLIRQDSSHDVITEGEVPRRRRRTNTMNSQDYDPDLDNYSTYGFETPLVTHHQFGSSQQISVKRKASVQSFQRSLSQNDGTPDVVMQNCISTLKKEQHLGKSGDTVNLGSSIKIFDEKLYYPLKQYTGDISKHCEDSMSNVKMDDERANMKVNGNNNEHLDDKKERKEHILKRIGRVIVKFFDLDLLTDPGYVILMIGMSLAICAELNFSLFTPLMLIDMKFSVQQTATIMSIIASADIVFRFLAPFVQSCIKFSAQNMYLSSLVMLILSRTCLMIFQTYTSTIVVACLLGVAKGFRTVYMSLVIPSYVPLERLPSASGIQSLVNCLFVIMSIPMMAAVRSATGGFIWSIAALNCITFATVCMWTTQLLYKKCYHQQQAPA